MRFVRSIWLAAALALVAGGLSLHAQYAWSVSKTLPIGGEGAWDYVTVDSPGHRLFVTRTTHTMVIDADSGKTLGDILGQKRAHGVAIVPALNRGFISDGAGNGAITIFDLKTYSVLGTLASVADADGIIYDPGTNLVLVSAGDSSALLAFKPDIDPVNGKVGAPIELGGKPEFLAVDGHGKAFVNLEDKGLVAVVDLKARKTVQKWPVAPGGHPVGLSIDAKAHRLFIGCRDPQKLIVMNSDTGKVEASLPIGAGVDATAFSEGQAFASCGDSTFFVAEEKGSKFEITQAVKTPAGARTLGVDAKSHRIYLPTAELEPVTAGRPKPKPGTFKIVVIERH